MTPARVVGIGASAGGVQALERFFRHAPVDAGNAYVVLLHMAVDAHSHLAEVLSKCTSMPVTMVVHGLSLAGDHVYVLAPGTLLSLMAGALVVHEDQHRLPAAVIDSFFTSLARDQGDKSVGVVLSGSGKDGTVGLSAIREAGGVCMVQSPSTAMHAVMPRNAMMAGLADHVLPPEELGRLLAGSNARTISQPPDPTPCIDARVMAPIFDILRRQTGHDFSEYKQSTLSRRIRRRMSLRSIVDVNDYVTLLGGDTHEAERLFDDFLINVTHFFRDPAAFDTLRDDILPALLEKSTLRIWVPACSTGEEAYSLAMLLHSLMVASGKSPHVRIFATDIDARAIAHARAGIYAASDLHTVPKRHAERYFSRIPEGFRISNDIRQMCVFAEQDLVRDPPFSRLDMICCRNLLIYMETALQARVFSIFQFALNHKGILMLGAAESNANGSELFSHVSLKHKIYEKKTSSMPVIMPVSSAVVPPVSLPICEESTRMNSSIQQEAERYLISQFAPPSVIVDDQLNITGFFGDVGPFIQPVAGAASLKLFKMARPELTAALTSLIDTAMSTFSPGQHPPIPLEIGGKSVVLTLRVVPMTSTTPGSCLVIFESRDSDAANNNVIGEGHYSAQIRDARSSLHEIEAQNRFLRDELRRLRTEQISSGEELQAANEEIQSTNEELQSTNEELESAKEELQSTNEELTSINTELSAKIADLTDGNDDLLSMLSSLDMPLVLLSRDLNIIRFTSPARALLNLIDGDVGRPFSHVRPNIELPALETLCVQVLDSRVTQSVKCRTATGESYSLSVRPHLSGSGAIAGILLVFVNVSALHFAPDATHERSLMSRDVDDIVNLLDQEGRFITWSERAEQYYGYSEVEALQMSVLDIVAPSEHEGIISLLQSVRDKRMAVPVRQRRLCKNHSTHEVFTRLTAMYDQRGDFYAFALNDSPLDTGRAHDCTLSPWLKRLDQVDEALIVLTPDGEVIGWEGAAEALFGYTSEDIIGTSADRYWTEPVASWIVTHMAAASANTAKSTYSTIRKSKSGEDVPVTGDYLVLHCRSHPFLLAMREEKA